MNQNQSLPFNLFAWSLILFLLYFFVQFALTIGYASSGASLSPWTGVVTWFAVSAAIGYSLERRYQPKAAHMWVLQGMACFYMLLASGAVTFRQGAAINIDTMLKLLVVIAALFAVGLIGFFSAAVYRQKFQF